MKKGILGFVAVVVIIALVSFTAISGLNLGVVEIPSAVDGIRLGLDLQGGAMITFEAKTEDGSTPSAEDMEIAQTVLRRRLDTAGYTEGSVQKAGDNRLTVEIPSVTDPEEAVALLGKTAVLEFRDTNGAKVLDGADVKSATAVYGPLDETNINQHYMVIEFTPEGRQKFAEATRVAMGKTEDQRYISAYLDEDMIMNAMVQEVIDMDSCQVTFGNGTSNEAADEVRETANLINSGRLPFALEEIELRSVGPTLGEKALETSLFAGLIGLLLVMIFMMIMYRLPGVIASISLVFYSALMIVIMSILNVNLSLPGIAGIVLSIGMAVDANVIIYERIKEELRVGKTLKASIDAGFRRAFTAILDSNVTTLIAAVVLYFLGMGTVVGFAITLGLGVIVSMFTVLVVSRFLLYRLVDMNIKSLKAYGA